MQTKVYGNSSSDGFGLFAAIITTVFVAGGMSTSLSGVLRRTSRLSIHLWSSTDQSGSR